MEGEAGGLWLGDLSSVMFSYKVCVLGRLALPPLEWVLIMLYFPPVDLLSQLGQCTSLWTKWLSYPDTLVSLMGINT